MGDALSLQTIVGMADFNSLVKKRPGTCYYASAGDADLNGDRELSPEERQTITAARQKAFEIDPAVLKADQELVDQLMPTLDEKVRAAYPSAGRNS